MNQPLLQHLFNPARYWNDHPPFLAVLDAQDAEMDQEDSLSARYAFQLGIDLGVLRYAPREHWASSEIERGYRHGLTCTAKVVDVYTRKLLTLRCNAYSRGIPFSSALTRDHLQRISVVACPVSGVELTHGALTDSDWSVDRLDNALGYVPGNLCIVSARVNRLKDRLDWRSMAGAAVLALLCDGEEMLCRPLDNGLLTVEALRLAALMAAPSSFAAGGLARYTPFAMAPSAWTTIDGVVAGIHVACARSRVQQAAYLRRTKLFKRLGRVSWNISNRLVDVVRAKLSAGTHPADIWFDGHALTLLKRLTDEFMDNPPIFDGLNAEAFAEQLKSGIAPLVNYSRPSSGSNPNAVL